MANRKTTEAWLEGVELVTEPTPEQMRALDELIGHEGFAVFLGLMLSARQGLYMQLSSMPLDNERARYLASVLQGKVKGIDMIQQTLLDLTPEPSAEPAPAKPEESHNG